VIRAQPLSAPAIAAAYISGHLVLDWLSFVHPYGAFGITPWNASTGLSFVMVLLLGWRSLPVVLTAIIVAAVLVRGLPVPFWLTLVEALVRTTVYGLILLTLVRPSVRFDPSLPSLRDLLLLLAAAVISSATIAGTYVGLLLATGLLPAEDAAAALLRCWVGDMIGIAVVTPFGLLMLKRERPLKLSWESALQAISSIGLAMWVAVVFAEYDDLKLFYLLFLPITWIAVRSGIEGVSAALVLVQAGLFIALLLFTSRSVDVLDFQARMLVLAATGLVAGVLVTERRLAELQQRMNQYALAHVSRLGSMGELAAAIAHEINQPLSAARTYTGLVAESLQTETLRDPSTVEMAGKAAQQISRAADVVRRLRALVRMGRISLVPTSIGQIVQESTDLARTDLDRHRIALKVDVAAGLPAVMADRLQVEQVLINLIRNSTEAIAGVGSGHREIAIAATKTRPGFVDLSVSDTGPGFPAAFTGDVPPPLSTTKVDGLGIGLSLCRSIAEAHGGVLSIESRRSGATVRISLPTAEETQDG